MKPSDSAINILLDVVRDQSGKTYKMDHFATRYPTNVIDIGNFLVTLSSKWSLAKKYHVSSDYGPQKSKKDDHFQRSCTSRHLNHIRNTRSFSSSRQSSAFHINMSLRTTLIPAAKEKRQGQGTASSTLGRQRYYLTVYLGAF